MAVRGSNSTAIDRALTEPSELRVPSTRTAPRGRIAPPEMTVVPVMRTVVTTFPSPRTDTVLPFCATTSPRSTPASRTGRAGARPASSRTRRATGGPSGTGSTHTCTRAPRRPPRAAAAAPPGGRGPPPTAGPPPAGSRTGASSCVADASAAEELRGQRQEDTAWLRADDRQAQSTLLPGEHAEVTQLNHTHGDADGSHDLTGGGPPPTRHPARRDPEEG